MWGNIYISTGGDILQYTLPAIFYKNGFSSMPSGCILYHFNINLRASPQSADSIFVFLFRNTWPEAGFFLGGGGGDIVLCGVLLLHVLFNGLLQPWEAFMCFPFSRYTFISVASVFWEHSSFKRNSASLTCLISLNLFLVRRCSLMHSK